MLLPGAVLCENNNQKAALSFKPLPRTKFDEGVENLAELVRQSSEPLDYFKISEALGLPLISRHYSRYVYFYPDSAKRRVTALLNRFPDQFELTTIERVNRKGIPYSAPAVRTIPEGKR